MTISSRVIVPRSPTITTGPGVQERSELLVPAPAAITLQGVSKTFDLPHQKRTRLKERAAQRFGSRPTEVLHALDDVGFEVGAGEFFGIVGRNGSGKSTLLRCIAGIYGIDAGSIEVDGRSVALRRVRGRLQRASLTAARTRCSAW